MNQPNEPKGLNRFIELDRMTSIESTEMRVLCLRLKIDAAVRGATKRKYHVRFNRTN